MSFLAPLFLLGALAIAAPVIFHLIRRTTRDRTRFSSLMFLQPTPPRLTKRSRLENLLLLLLRCLALALLAFGFSRPFFKQSTFSESSTGPAKRIVVLVDASASMRRASLWTDARARVESSLRNVGAADQVAIYTFGATTKPLVSFGEWSATSPEARLAFATARLAETSPTWSGTNLGAAVITAAEALADAEGAKTIGPRQIVLIGDLQSGSRLEALQAYEWPKGIEVIVEPLKAKNPTNAGLQLLAETTDTDRQSLATVRVRVSNSAESTREQFKVGWLAAAGGEFSGAVVDTYVPPGQSRIVSLPVTAGASLETIGLRGDDEDFDNTLAVIPPAQQRISVAYYGAEKPDDSAQPLFFLQRALSETPRLAITVAAQSLTDPLTDAARASSLMLVTDALPAAQALALREQAMAGKTILVALKSTAGAASLAPLLGIETLAVEEGKPASYAMLAEIDFQHPLFAPFADPRYSDFTKIHFWKYRKLDAAAIPGARVLARFDRGDPALLEVPTGKGRVLILTAGWQPEDSQLAVSSKFVPLLYALLEFSGALSMQASQYFVGDSVALSTPATEGTAVRRPDGTSTALAVGATQFAEANQPGIYRLTATGGRTQSFAVNLDVAESRTSPISIDELERLGVPLLQAKPPAQAETARQVALQGAEAEGRQKLWRWFLLATLAVLLGETLLAGWTARKTSPVSVPSSP